MKSYGIGRHRNLIKELWIKKIYDSGNYKLHLNSFFLPTCSARKVEMPIFLRKEFAENLPAHIQLLV